MATKARAKKPAAKKAATRKPAAKKAAPKKTAAKKKEVVKYTAADVKLNKRQETALRVIKTNEERIQKAMHGMLDIAFATGQKLLSLKEEIQKTYGRVWKEWAEANLGVSYPQASRYMKLAATPDQYALLDDRGVRRLEPLQRRRVGRRAVVEMDLVDGVRKIDP